MYYLKRVARGENKKRDSGTLGTLVIHQSAEGEAELWWQWSRVDTVKRRRRVCLHSHHGWRVVGVWGSDYWSCFVLCEPCCHRAVRVVVRVVSEPSEARAGCMQSDGIMTADMNGWAGAGRVEKETRGGDARLRAGGTYDGLFLFGPVALCRECRVMVYSGELSGWWAQNSLRTGRLCVCVRGARSM